MNEISLDIAPSDSASMLQTTLPKQVDLRIDSQISEATYKLESGFATPSLSVPGLKPITASKAIQSINDDNCFGLDLEREKGGSFLSSQIHSDLRKGVFNALGSELRLELISRKFSALGIFPVLGWTADNIVNVTDIGGERAVYKVDLDFEDETRSFVLKRELGDRQGWYAELVSELGLPSYDSKHFKLRSGEYEVTEWLPGRTLSKFLLDLKDLDEDERVMQLDTILPKLAQLAALNDIIGLGDHHHDNKIVGTDGEIRQIDISRWVFDKDNDYWTTKYIVGGWYEPSIILYYPPHLQLEAQERFFINYRSAVQRFSEDGEIFRNSGEPAFIDRALADPELFSDRMELLYKSSFPEMRKRTEMKNLLTQLSKTSNGSTLLQTPKYALLRMYLLADYNRPCAFYLLEDKEPRLIELQLNDIKEQVLAASTI